jgi:ABC-type branched-subunit amino acid transport system ATPase component
LSADLTLPGLPLRARGITAGYGGDPVIRDITVQTSPGEVVSLVGPNGSGKSTLLKSMVGVVRVASGTVRVGDRDLTNAAPEDVARAAVGYVPQVDDVFAPLTVLDEPTANLAPRVAGTLLTEHVRKLAASGAAVLIVEQRARAVLAISDRTYVLGGGEVRMAGTPAELTASPDFVESFLGGGRGQAAAPG